jgi:glutamate synthase domain-containing protein 3
MIAGSTLDEVVSEDGPHDLEIDCKGLDFKDLNDRIRTAALDGAESMVLRRVYGQRYIGTRLNGLSPVRIDIHGVPGNDLGAFMDGHRLIVHGNAQDGVGNTMHGGEIVVKGRAGDVLGMSMVAGSIMVRDDVGYRASLHMKEYGKTYPVVVVGGTAQDFLGEYMAGGRVVILGRDVERHEMSFIGTGMHGGIIYIRGDFRSEQLGEGTRISELQPSDLNFLESHVERYKSIFDVGDRISPRSFRKLMPRGTRPYSRLYA